MLKNLIVSTFQSSMSFVAAAHTAFLEDTGASVLAVQVNATVSTAAAKAFASGTAELQTLTFTTKAGATGGDYFVVTDTNGLTWAAALNKSGSDPAPVGAIYTAIPSGRKVNVNISSATTAAQVAALVNTAFDALTGVAAVFVTDVTAADGTMKFTQVESGNVANPGFHNANDSGAGSITGVTTTPGVAGDVNVANDLITEVAHGFLTGAKGQMTTSSALPTGLSTSTDYYVIKISDDTYKLASSLSNAQAGTPINLTSIGAGNQTFTPTSIAGATATLMKSIDGTNYFSEGAAQNITSTGALYFEKVDPSGKFYRVDFAITAGQLTVIALALGKGLDG